MTTPAETKPATTPENAAVEEEKQDPTLGARRLLVLILSLILGVAGTAGGMYGFPVLFGKAPMPIDAQVPISVLEIPLLLLGAIPFGLFFMIWLDYFMGTKIVRD